MLEDAGLLSILYGPDLKADWVTVGEEPIEVDQPATSFDQLGQNERPAGGHTQHGPGRGSSIRPHYTTQGSRLLRHLAADYNATWRQIYYYHPSQVTTPPSGRLQRHVTVDYHAIWRQITTVHSRLGLATILNAVQRIGGFNPTPT